MSRKNYNKFFSKEPKGKTSSEQEAIKVGQGGFAKALNDESSEKRSEEVKMEPQKIKYDTRKIAYDMGQAGEDSTVIKLEDSNLVIKSENKPAPQKENYTEKQVTKCGFLNVRAEPDVNAKVVGMIKRDAIVHVLVNDGDWSKILIPGNRAEYYVKSEFLTLRKVF